MQLEGRAKVRLNTFVYSLSPVDSLVRTQRRNSKEFQLSRSQVSLSTILNDFAMGCRSQFSLVERAAPSPLLANNQRNDVLCPLPICYLHSVLDNDQVSFEEAEYIQ